MMEEKILEILKRKAEYHDNQETFFRLSSEEITAHVFEFIEWIQDVGWNKYKGLNWWFKKDKNFPPKHPPLTLNELYEYWLTKIKKS